MPTDKNHFNIGSPASADFPASALIVLIGVKHLAAVNWKDAVVGGIFPHGFQFLATPSIRSNVCGATS